MLRRWLHAFAYRPAPGRDLWIELLRGCAVLGLMVDPLAGGSRFFPAAAVFVFLSGLMVGQLARRLAEQEGLGAALRRLVERAWAAYVLAVSLTLLLLPISERLHLPWARGVDLRHPPALVWSILTLQQPYDLVDLLRLYTLLLALTPLALLLLYEGRAWLVLAASWLIWAGPQFIPGTTAASWPASANALFSTPAWHALFFTAMAVGYHHDRFQAPVPRSGGRALLVVLRLAAGAVFGRAEPGGGARTPRLSEHRRGVLAPPGHRGLNLRAHRYERCAPLLRGLGWLLVPLGRHALYAYSAHAALAVASAILVIQAGLPFPGSPQAMVGLQVASIALAWLAVRVRMRWPLPAGRGWQAAGPAAIAATLVLFLAFDPAPSRPDREPASAAAAQARAARVFGTPVPRDRTRPTEGTRAGPVSASAGQPAPTPLATQAPRASGRVGSMQGTLRGLQFYSAALDRDASYFIYLPPGYGAAGQRYPALYLLDSTSIGTKEQPAHDLVDALDDLIVAGVVGPMIVILPGDDDWVAPAQHDSRWGDSIAYDLVRHVDASFRTLPTPEGRAVGGLSTGATGALQLAFAYPHVFRVVGAHSPSLRAEEAGREAVSAPGSGAEQAERDPVRLAATAPGLDRLQIWIDLGSEDPWFESARLLHDRLAGRGLGHEWSVLAGDHDPEYWQRNVVAYLRFYDRALYGPRTGN